jgi:hypothetical protein
MKNKVRCLIFMMLSLLGYSCVSVERSVVNQLAQYGSPYDAVWHKKLVKERIQVKDSWLNYFDIESYKESPQLMGYDIGLTESDLDKVTCVPIEFYMFPTSSFHAWKPENSIEENMVLLKDRMYCFMAIDGIFFDFGCANLKNDKWEVGAGGSFNEFDSKTLSELYFKKKLPLIIICVTEKDYGWIGNFTFFAFKENGVLKCVDRKQIKPLSDVLLSYQSLRKGEY